jgi:hypothetical protein
LGIRGGMPEILLSVLKGFVDGGMISAPNNLRGMKLGLREMVDAADYGICIPTRRSARAALTSKTIATPCCAPTTKPSKTPATIAMGQ